MSKSTSQIVALAVADIHLTHAAPTFRSAEPNWYAAMARPMRELRKLQELHQVPILCAGDVFDRWDSRPELINWAIKNVPHMYSIPGQHDLPQHRLDDISKSAYWTLCEAGVLSNLSAGEPWKMKKDVWIWPFPWGHEPEIGDSEEGVLNIALVHQYVWIKGSSYPGAPADQRVSLKRKLTAFDVAVFGDNHQGFLTRIGTKTTVFNCGTFFRRKADEAGYRPQVGLIYRDGFVLPHPLTCVDMDLTKDLSDVSPQELRQDFRHFIEKLGSLSKTSLDFRSTINQFIDDNRVESGVRDVLSEVMNEASK